MNLQLHTFGASVQLVAEAAGLAIRGPRELTDRQAWPADALAAPGGWRSAVEIEQLLELGLADIDCGTVFIPYGKFASIRAEMPVSLIDGWVTQSPFLLKIDRRSDVGRPDFVYRFSYLLGGIAVEVERIGYYVRRASRPEIFILDFQMYSLVEAMDAFNGLPSDAKTPQTSWLTFAKVKGCAAEVGAHLDITLQKNDVIVPSMLGLDMREDTDGALTFLPKCSELANEEFHNVFERNADAEKLYSLDRPGLQRVRIVLTDEQQEVLRRMKRVRRIKGDLKERIKRDPVQVFDGIADHIELPYSDRVIGIGDFEFAPTPRPADFEATMAELWKGQATEAPVEKTPEEINQAWRAMMDSSENGGREGTSSINAEGDGDPATTKRSDSGHSVGAGELTSEAAKAGKYLLIQTNEESVRNDMISGAARAAQLMELAAFECPSSLRADRQLRPHQEDGVRWLQTCSRIKERTGVLLADDMGVGKTVQVLTFLAWCIQSGRYPDLSRSEPPFRPILIIAPLILLDTRTWEAEMENFFHESAFWPILILHGDQLARFRRDDAEGREVEIGKPVLDLNRIQRHRVVITNYETVKTYQHSFAYLKDGQPLWSFIITDEAQEYKVPNTKISHAMKALKADMHIACTGTPVENRLLDLWNICDAVQPGLLSSAKEFVKQYEKAVPSEHYASTLTELKKRLLFEQPHAFLLRRTKTDVADLPPKTIDRVYCDMSDEEIAAHQDLLRALRQNDKQSRYLAALHGFVHLYQHPALLAPNPEDLRASELLARSSKLRTLVSTLHKIRAKHEKVIVFARLRSMQAILAKVLETEFELPVRIINGETKLRSAGPLTSSGVKTRNAILNDFRRRPGFNILVLSPFVAGIGLTIVEANHVVHYGRWWNPAVESQATDRAYRIGQTKQVFVYLPILRDPSRRVDPSFDERLNLLMQRKQRLAADFLRPLAGEDELGAELIADLSAEAKQG